MDPRTAFTFLVLLLGSAAPVRADDAVKFIFARMGSPDSLVYTIDGRELSEDQLPSYFKANDKKWPKSGTELRVVFRNDVSLAWFDYGCRSFRIRGFRKIHCFSGSERTGKGIEVRSVGDVIVLPDARW